MQQIAVVVEGQTEGQFISTVLAPHLWNFDIYLAPMVVTTSVAASGTRTRGGGGWIGYRKQIKNLLGQSHWRLVTTMIDFYAYPSDAPGFNCPRPHTQRPCVRQRAEAMAADFADQRFAPFVMLHEFETLVFAAGIDQPAVLGDVGLPSKLREEAGANADDVELINDSPNTAPSKRVARLWPGYKKPFDGVSVIEQAGIPAVASRCPGFASWLTRLESAGS